MEELHAYKIEYDSTHYLLFATTFEAAIEKWRSYVKEAWGTDYVGDEQPESVERLWGIVIR